MKNYILIVLFALNSCFFASYSQEIYGYKNEDGTYGYFYMKKDQKGLRSIYSKVEPYTEGMACVLSSGKRGAINKLGELIIPLDYTIIGEFKNGAALFNLNGTYSWDGQVIGGKWGIINNKNERITPAIYDQLIRINEDLFVAKKENKWGVINQNNKKVISFIYDRLELIENELLIAKKGVNWGVITSNSKIIVPFKYTSMYAYTLDYLIVKQGETYNKYGTSFGGKWKLIDKSGKVVLNLNYDEVAAAHDSLLVVRNDDFRWGYVDLKGNEVTPLKYNNTELFEEFSPPKFVNGYAIVYYDGRYGVIDEKAHEVIATEYDEIKDLGNGIVSFKSDEKWGYMTLDGKVLFPAVYDEVYPFCSVRDRVTMEEEFIAKVETNGLLGIVNTHGVELLKPKYSFIDFYCDGVNKILVMLDSKYGMIDAFSGKEIIAPIYDELQFPHEVFIVGKLNDQSELFNENGKSIVPLGDYSYFSIEDDPISITIYSKTNEELGVIDGDGKKIVPITRLNSLNLAETRVNDKYGFEDASGNEVIPPIYNYAYVYNDGYVIEVRNENWEKGVIDKTGKLIVPYTYDDVQLLSADLILISLNGKKGLLTSFGETIIPLIYDNIFAFTPDYILVSLNGKIGFTNSLGKEIIPLIYDNVLDVYYDRIHLVKGKQAFYLNIETGELTEL